MEQRNNMIVSLYLYYNFPERDFHTSFEGKLNICDNHKEINREKLFLSHIF